MAYSPVLSVIQPRITKLEWRRAHAEGAQAAECARLSDWLGPVLRLRKQYNEANLVGRVKACLPGRNACYFTTIMLEALFD